MNTAPDLAPALTPAPEVLIKEARRRQRRRYLLATAATVAVAASAVAVFGGSGAGGRPRPPGPAPSPSRHTPPPATGRATGLVTVSQTRLPKPNSLSLAVGFRAVWVTGTGVTYEINAATGRIMRTISTPGTFPDGCRSGIAAGAGAVWVTHSCRGVYRIDPRTGRVTASIRVPDVGDAIAVDDGLVWMPNYNGWLLRMQPRTGRIVGKRIPVGFGDWVLIPSADALWVTSYGNGSATVNRVNPATGAAKLLTNIADIRAAGAGSLWTSEGQRVDPATGKVIASGAVPGSATLVTFWKGSAWALTEQRSLELLRISPATNQVSGKPIPVGNPFPAKYGSDPVAVTVGPTGLWVLDFGRNLLFHVVMRPAAAASPNQRR
ncbi:MAG: hypothetical protein ACLQFR_11805 [Streptosporangiaceae bacterium]